MKRLRQISAWFTRRRLAREDGAILVEFALALPLLLIFFAVIVEGTRMMKNYHTAISGVRDATRFMSRHLPIDLCAVAPADLNGFDTTLRNIVGQNVSGVTLFPSGIALTSVRATYTCPAGTFHVPPAVVTVTATMTITFPFSGVFALLSASPGGTLTATIRDSAKVYGA